MWNFIQAAADIIHSVMANFISAVCLRNVPSCFSVSYCWFGTSLVQLFQRTELWDWYGVVAKRCLVKNKTVLYLRRQKMSLGCKHQSMYFFSALWKPQFFSFFHTPPPPPPLTHSVVYSLISFSKLLWRPYCSTKVLSRLQLQFMAKGGGSL